MLALDWITLTCYGYPKQTDKVKLIEQKVRTRQFNKVSDVIYNDKIFGVIAYQPSSSALKDDLINFKIENSELYNANLFESIAFVCESLGIHISGVSRVDICNDFNHFDSQLHPTLFINNVFKGVYLKNGRSQFQTVNELETLGKIKDEKSKHAFLKQIMQSELDYLDIKGFGRSKGIEPTYLCYGQTGGLKQVKLYNKTNEMNKKTFKKWIYDRWVESGLNVDDVWRLEVSIKPRSQKILDENTGEYIPITYETIQNPENLKNIYQTFVKQMFSFKRKGKGLNKSRFKDVVLFKELTYCPFKVKIISNSVSHGQTEKRFVNMLFKTWERTQDENVKNIMLREISYNGLDVWFFIRHPEKWWLPHLNCEMLSNHMAMWTPQAREDIYFYLKIKNHNYEQMVDIQSVGSILKPILDKQLIQMTI